MRIPVGGLVLNNLGARQDSRKYFFINNIVSKAHARSSIRFLTLLTAFSKFAHMFTGIVEETGTVISFHEASESWHLRIQASKVLEDLRLGDSLAVNGCCLTARSFDRDEVEFDLLGETVQRTSICNYGSGMLVNLERSLTPSTRMGGHFVTGHIDTTGEILDFEARGKDVYLRVQTSDEFMNYLVFKGSISVDGVSLTVTEVGDDWFSVWLIPHTLEVTNLSERSVGEIVNLEFDMLAKYVNELLNKQNLQGRSPREEAS